ncbi:MAG: ferrochelatase [Pseudomonadales bacterium]|nr:ferrochelatase [Pseudomonadales bacterium]
MIKKGILLLNLGSPDAPTTAAVKRYLGEFLMDPFVVNLPRVLRWLLVKLIIVPFRSKKSAAAYQAIWPNPAQEAPLIQHTRALGESLLSTLENPQGYSLAIAMRYGQPSIEEALTQLINQQVEEIYLLPQYPHHADSTRTTSINAVAQTLRKLNAKPKLHTLPPFYRDPKYIAALVQDCQKYLPDNIDHLLFSFHGLPEQHIRNADPTGSHCLSENCCDTPSKAHAYCYRHQVYATAKLVAQALGIDNYSVSFQSRLGRQQWLTPYTDQVLKDLPEDKHHPCKNIAVICPAFTVDNLETLEEIDIRGREIFTKAGGLQFTMIPCLNQNAEYVKFLAEWCAAQSPLL